MTKILSFAAVVGLLVAASSTADARGMGMGASSFAPGQSFRAHGPVAGHPGASGYAPGHQGTLIQHRGRDSMADAAT